MDKNQNTLDENLENKVDEVKEDLHEAREDVKEHMERAKERARDTFDDVKEKAEDAKERVKNEAADIKEDMKNFGKTHPWSFLGKLEEFGHEYLVKKAPFQLPDGFKEFLVKIAPYAIIIVAVLAVPAILALFGLSSSLWGEL